MDTYLSKVFHKKTLKENKMFRRDIGDLKHIFSHVTHHMGIEHIHFEQKDISSPDTGTFTFPPTIVQSKSSTTGCEIRWMKIEEMQSLGITTGVHKILQRVLSKKEKVDTKKPPSSQVKRPSSTTGSTVKKVRTLTSFFKK
jgi:A/G-specific adenine glycosylase